jgi:hypothetical protein
MPDDVPAALFCPECAHSFASPPAAGSGPVVCPCCGKQVELIDYARMPLRPALSAPTKRATPSAPDRALWAAAGVSAALVVAVAAAAWTGRSSLALWCGVLGAAAASVILCRFALLAQSLKRTRHAQERAERSLMIATASLEAAAAVNRGFHKNLANVVAEERRRVQAEQTSLLAKLNEEKEQVAWRVRRVEDQMKIVRALGDRILDVAMDRVLENLTARNFDACRRELNEAFAFCRDHDYPLSRQQEEQFLLKLAHRYNQELRSEQERQRQAALAHRLQSERQVDEEVASEISRAAAESAVLRRKLAEAQAASDTAESSSTTLKRLRDELHAVEQRAAEVSTIGGNLQAGHVLVLSNVGSFGPGVLKICMTRRLDFQDAVAEMSREATPFPFDVHMAISTQRASELLHELHDALHAVRINRVDFGRDFFRTDVDTVWRLVAARHGGVECRTEPAAEEHRQSVAMDDEQFRQATAVMQGAATSTEVRFD